MKRTRVCDLLGIQYPIIQAPMLWISRAELVAAVSEAGGMGTIGVNAGVTTPTKDVELLGESLRSQINKVRSLTDKPFAVNILVPMRQDDVYSEKYVQVAIEEHVPAVAVAGDDPDRYTERFKRAGVTVLHRPLNCSVQRAREAELAGADAVIVVGFEGGGHSGLDRLSNLVLLPQVVDAVNVPVILGGGLADARGMVAAFALGAEGIYMGTRFIATSECPAHQNFKQAVIDASETSTVTFDFPVAVTRCMKNPLAEQALEMQAKGVPPEEIERRVFAGKARAALLEGDLSNGAGFFSPIAGMIKEIVGVRKLIDSLVQGYDAVLGQLE